MLFQQYVISWILYISNKKIKSYRNLITFIKDRPGHDRRYSINPKKISNELNWIPKETFDSGIDKTLDWYLLNQNWVNNIISGEYVNWLKKTTNENSHFWI